MSLQGNHVLGGKKKLIGVYQAKLYVSLSVFGRMAVLVGSFLSCLNTRLVTKQCRLCHFKLGCRLYCGKQPLYSLFLRICWQTSKVTRNRLCLTLCFRSTDVGGSLSHRRPVAARPCRASSRIPGEPGAESSKTLQGVTQVREKGWEHGSLLILH